MPMKPLRRSRRTGVLGYALLEALIAVIVTSVGFIGAARLQTVGMGMSSDALFRQKATLLGNQMTDRMRANKVGMEAGAYNNPTPATDTACLSSTAGCTPAQLAAADMRQWLDDVAQLPGGTGVVCVDGDPSTDLCDNTGVVLAVRVSWTDKLGTNSFVTVARP